MIKGIIFDYGGVIAKGPSLYELCDIFAKENKIDANKFRDVFLSNWRPARLNQLSQDDFWTNIAGEFGISPRKLRKDLLEFFKVDENMLTFLKQLKKANYKLAMLSNNIPDFFEDNNEKNHVRKYFDSVILSYEVGLAKPDLRIYELALSKIGLKANECIYIDDMSKNLPTAQQLGMKAIQFKGLDILKNELIYCGVKF